MGAQPGDEKLHPNCQHLPLLRALQGRLLQGLQWQTVSEGGCSAHHIHPFARFIKGVIELRKRGVIPKEANVANQMGTQADRDRVREATSLRREKRGGMRGGRGGRGGKQLSDSLSSRACRQSIGAKSRVYDNKGRLLSNSKDMCDCLDVDCMGCFYPCPDCGSRKCGVECRCDRKWLYEQVEVEGGEIIRNKFAI
ncbi:ARL14 effector protein isoform X3 [Micropterus dolomieu]|uniref:ARL14 effector protein isoform X3 n=1 Tax=Micropterus dolomieu TaxID=147949 RepID=UPI001E8E6E11|nr:ARL14 effector protein isoform X3 [Micropterus dolomieu]